MAYTTEVPKEPYYCPQCEGYFYHMATGVVFIACPDCDDDDERDQQRQTQ